MNNFIDRISDLADLEAKASPGPWEYESQESGFSEEIIGYMTKPDLEDMLNGKDCDVALACALRNKAIPLLKEILGALLTNEKEIESLRTENKQLKDAIAQAEQFIELIKTHGLEYALSKVVKA